MKNIFSSTPSNFQTHLSLLILRVGSGILMLTHGWPKLTRLVEGGEITFPDPLGIGSFASLLFAMLTEVVGSILIMLGLATRFAAISLIFTMIVAVFIHHADDPFARKELGLMYLLIYIVILIMGSGKYAIDRFIRK
ncbi:MAG: DoxX family protein [Bacteroidetes bacterium]|nr:MAG: DoxX family protein [Bacteroidota bacterium]